MKRTQRIALLLLLGLGTYFGGYSQFHHELITTGYFPNGASTAFSGWHGGLQISSYGVFEKLKNNEIPNSGINIDYFSPKLNSSFGLSYYPAFLENNDVKKVSGYYSKRLEIGTLKVLPTLSAGVIHFPVINHYNPVLPEGYSHYKTRVTADAALGMIYKNVIGAVSVNDFNAVSPLSFEGVIGYVKSFNNWIISPKAKILVSKSIYHQNPVLVDLAMNASKDNLFLSVSSTTLGNLSFGIGYQFKNVARISYSYNSQTSDLIGELIDQNYQHSISVRFWMLKAKRADHRLFPDLGIM